MGMLQAVWVFLRGLFAGRAAGRWWNLGAVPPGRWHQVALAWRGEWVDGSVDGEWRNAFLVRGGLGPLFEQLGDKLPIGIGDAWIVYAADGQGGRNHP